jgi:hypothetical protein
LRPTSTVSSTPTLRERFMPTISRALLTICLKKSLPTVWLSSRPMADTRSLPMFTLSSFFTRLERSFSACIRKSSWPAASSNMSSL